VPLAGLTPSQIRTTNLLAVQWPPTRPGRLWALPAPARVLLVLIHLRTNLTTHALTESLHATPWHTCSMARDIRGDGGYRGITSIATPRRDPTGRIIGHHHYRTHHRNRARVEHVIARLKDWQILRQCRRRAGAINQSLQIIAGLWNFKTHTQLRVNS
jgi:hypothetical protein